MKNSIWKRVASRLELVGVCVVLTLMTGCGGGGLMHAQIRSELGIKENAPNLSSIATYSAADPELKEYLNYIGALDSGIQGVVGKKMDDKTYAAQLKLQEEEMIKLYQNQQDSMFASRDEYIAMSQKHIDQQKKMGPPYYLARIPKGADPKWATARTYKEAVVGNEDIENHTTQVSLTYQFRTVEERNRKADEILSKLRPVFTGHTGWEFRDPAYWKKHLNESIESTENNKHIGNEQKRGLINHNKTLLKKYEAGSAEIIYMWNSGYTTKHGALTLSDSNMVFLGISAMPEPYDKMYQLTLSFSKSVKKPRNK